MGWDATCDKCRFGNEGGSNAKCSGRNSFITIRASISRLAINMSWDVPSSYVENIPIDRSVAFYFVILEATISNLIDVQIFVVFGL